MLQGVSMLCRVMSCPGEEAWTAAMHMIKWMRGQKTRGIKFTSPPAVPGFPLADSTPNIEKTYSIPHSGHLIPTLVGSPFGSFNPTFVGSPFGSSKATFVGTTFAGHDSQIVGSFSCQFGVS